MVEKIAKSVTDLHISKISGMVVDFSGIILDRLLFTQIARKIAMQMSKYSLTNPDEYISMLCHSGTYTFVMEDLIASLTVNESYFFRNYHQMEYLYKVYFKEYFNDAGRNTRPLKVWSAGCSRGEETYSASILLDLSRERFPWAQYRVYGGDINSINLQLAIKGSYAPRSVRGNFNGFGKAEGMVPGHYDDMGNFILDKKYKQHVSFEKLNLKLENDLKKLMCSDIILCRNVLIYFTDELRAKLFGLFFRYLNPGGILLLGETEIMPVECTGFVGVNYNKAIIYRKIE